MKICVSNFIIALLLISVSFVCNSQNMDILESKVSFLNSNDTLFGTLRIPDSQQKVPAIIFLHGSGSMTREGFESYAKKYNKLGYATLAYDKRGSGKSTLHHSSDSYISDLSNDAIAAFEFIKSNSRIDTNRIGVWAISQGGWIISKIAPKIKLGFVICISGGGVSPYESEMFSFKKILEKEGYTGKNFDNGVEIAEAWLKMLGYGSVSEFREILAKYKGTTLQPMVDWLEPKVPTEPDKSAEWVYHYEPIDDISKIKCPVLLLFGSEDTDHPTQLAIQQWTAGLDIADNSDRTIVNFSKAGHGIRRTDIETTVGRPPFADGYKEIMIGWLFNLNLKK